MSWISGRISLLAVLFLTVAAFGQSVVFESRENSASLKHRPLNTRDHAGVQDIQLELSVPRLDINRDRDGFDQIEVKGLTRTVTAGNPELATTGNLLAVPQGYDVSLSVVDNQVQTLEQVLARPAQRKMRCDVAGMDTFHFNSAIYDSAEVFPANVAQLEEVGELQGVRLVRVAMNPVRMDFRGKKLLVSSRLVVNAHFTQIGKVAKSQLPESIYRVLKASAINTDSVGSLIEEASAPETMIVVVADTLKSAIAPLVAWKQAKGLNVQVYTNTEAGGTKENVKSFLTNLYKNASVKPSFLLLVGNKDTMPTFMESTSSGSAASDWQYSLLSGNSDRIPDLFYGRFVADNEAEVATQVKRAVAYEKNPELAGWYHDGMTIASNEGSSPSDKDYAIQVQDALKKHTYQALDSFFQGEMTATAKNIVGALDTGRSWIAYFGHGSGTSWGSTNDYFGNSTVDALTNTRLPVIIDVACLNSSWVNMAKPFGKAWVTGESNGNPRGAVAFYGGSVSISWDPPAVMSVGVAKAHSEKGVTTVGAGVTAGQLYLFEQMGTGNDTLENIKWYNLFGDPSLMVRTNDPKQYQVKHEVVSQGGKAALKVSATASSGGVGGLLVSVSKAEERGTVAIAKTDANGNALVDLSSMGGLSGSRVTVTGYNAATFTENVAE